MYGSLQFLVVATVTICVFFVRQECYPDHQLFEVSETVMAGRSIRIFLVDGTPTGTRTAEIGLSTIKALVVPRASLVAGMARSEPQKTGVYVLIGQDAELPSLKRIYVGEGDTIITRITTHNTDEDKDFWDEVVLFVSKDDNLTKAHVRYVEARLIALAKSAKRSNVTNVKQPSEIGKLPEADQADMEEFINQARLLLGALGYDIFEPDNEPSPSKISATVKTATQTNSVVAFKAVGGIDATMNVDQSNGKFVVITGSKARKTQAASLQPTYKNLREQLIKNGILVSADDQFYQFTQDYAFNAPTAAAQVVCASSANGRTFWRHKLLDQTFADWQDAQLPQDTSSNEEVALPQREAP